MGELIFTLGYGGSLIVIGFVMRAFLKAIEVTEKRIGTKGATTGDKEDNNLHLRG